MIPKVLHHIWLSGDEKGSEIERCLDSWLEHNPEYDLKEWSLENIDINSSKFLKEAIEQKKWAFASDYLRIKILYEHGGIYADADVVFNASLDNLLNNSFSISFPSSVFFFT